MRNVELLMPAGNLEKLKYAIRDGLKWQLELDKWKRENMTPFMYVLNTPPVI